MREVPSMVMNKMAEMLKILRNALNTAQSESIHLCNLSYKASVARSFGRSLRAAMFDESKVYKSRLVRKNQNHHFLILTLSEFHVPYTVADWKLSLIYGKCALPPLTPHPKAKVSFACVTRDAMANNVRCAAAAVPLSLVRRCPRAISSGSQRRRRLRRRRLRRLRAGRGRKAGGQSGRSRLFLASSFLAG